MRYLACLLLLFAGLAASAEPVERPYVDVFRQLLAEDAARHGKTCSVKIDDIQDEAVVVSTRCKDAPNVCHWLLDEDGYGLIGCEPISPEGEIRSDLTIDKDSA